MNAKSLDSSQLAPPDIAGKAREISVALLHASSSSSQSNGVTTRS